MATLLCRMSLTMELKMHAYWSWLEIINTQYSLRDKRHQNTNLHLAVWDQM